jgi:acyl-coenzyme A thioesterase PaaI-like protein
VVRRLVDLTVSNTADAEETAAAAEELERVAARLAAHVPDPLPPRFVMVEKPAEGAHGMPYDPVTGRYNPLALPLEMRLEPDLAVGHVTFTTPYEGPPGCVHGAVLAGIFDMVLTAANQLEDAAGPTIDLALRYRRPTRLHLDTRFEGWIENREGKVVKAAGRALQDDKVTVEATGTFIKLPRDEVLGMANRFATD